MDGSQFDDLLRALSRSRRTILGASFAIVSGVAGLTVTDAKKKKKPCAKKCKDGCCTGKFGKCIKPAQQTATRCGTGGEICRSNCGGGNACGAGCDTCCANGQCVDAEQISNEQCGINGQSCFACPPGQACNAPGEGCCARKGAECGTNGVECCSKFFETCGPDNFCCVENGGPCAQTTDCCDDEDVCDGGQCGRPLGAACVPGDLICIPSLTCNAGTLTCDPRDCTIPCAEEGRCSNYTCSGGLYCCPTDVTDTCNVPEEICGCIIEGGYCTRV